MLCEFMDGPGYGVWCVENDSAPDLSDLALLDVTERARSNQYARERDRKAFVKSRATLRRLLAPAVGAAPEAIQFNENSWGKPEVAGEAAATTAFSVSHADGLTIIAISDGRKIGVDVERYRVVPDRDRIARDVFGSSIAEKLRYANDPNETFFRLWTAAEAFLKAIGTGFAGRDEPMQLELQESSGAVRLGCGLLARGQSRLTLLPLRLPLGFLGSLVVEDAAGTVCSVVADGFRRCNS